MTVGNILIDSPDAFSVPRKCEPQRPSPCSLWTLGFTVARVCSCLLPAFVSSPTDLALHHLASLVAVNLRLDNHRKSTKQLLLRF